MRKKKDFMGRSSAEDYLKADEYFDAPMAAERQRSAQKSQIENAMKEREIEERRKKMRESIQDIQDDLRYESDIELREAMRKQRQQEYKKRGF